jgi:Shikimate kinase
MMKNIILIGMPGCGKSTVGIVLAKIMGYEFIDSDLVIQKERNMLLPEIIELYGVDGFRKIENEINSVITANNAVIATGGSVVYGKEAMVHYKEIGTIVYIKLPCDEIAERVGDLSERGVAADFKQTIYDIYNERTPLYESYADITIESSGLRIDHTAKLIMKMITERRKS